MRSSPPYPTSTFLDTKAPEIIVFEDDAQPVERFAQLYDEFRDTVPKCEWCQLVHHPATRSLMKESPKKQNIRKGLRIFWDGSVYCIENWGL